MNVPLLKQIPPPQKVAIVRTSRIGDFICATPALRALRAALPRAELTLIGLPFVRDLVARSPHLDRFVAFPGWPGMAEQFFAAHQALAFLAAMQAERFDLAIQLNGSGVYANPFTLMLGARATAGYIRAGDPPGRLAAALPLPTTGPEPTRWLALPTHIGAPPCGEATEFPLWREDRIQAAALLGGAARPLIGLHPGSREASKCWPIDRYAALGRALWQRHGGTLVIVGGDDERPLAQRLLRECPVPALNLAGKTSLPVLGALIEHLALLVTNDSGPAHVAYALGTSSVTLFATTDPARWGPPRRQRHRVVQARAAPGPGAQPDIGAISLDDVLAAAEEALASATDGAAQS